MDIATIIGIVLGLVAIVGSILLMTPDLAMFGSPFKNGVQNGYPVWTYEYNFYNSLGSDITKDMVIVFDHRGVVKSHQMMTNQPGAVGQ